MRKTIIFLGLALLLIIGITAFRNPDETQPKDPNITITMSVSKWNIVVKGLRKLPMEESEEPYAIIIQQAQKQMSDTTTTKSKK